jgi:four helix bundle protein
MSEVKSYKDLLIWKRGMSLCKDIYLLTGEFPVQEQYGLTSQMRRCAVSVPSNIAEGFGRSTSSFINFLKISRGSLYELDTQLALSKELSFNTNEKLITHIENEIAEIGKMINTFLNKLKEKL